MSGEGTFLVRRDARAWFQRWRTGGSNWSDPNQDVDTFASCRSFSYFSLLSDEVQYHILSFIAEAPYENVARGDETSTLTDIFPLVSRKFCDMAKSNLLWKMVLERATQSDEVWRRAASASSINIDSLDMNPSINYRVMYKTLFDEKITFTGPVFIMGMDEESIPKQYSLYLFEPRYRYMIEQLLAQYDEWSQSVADSSEAEESVPPPLYFLHAHRGLGYHRSFGADDDCTALLVQMVRCMGMPNGHYNVTLRVDALVSIERYWVAPNTGNLYFAQGRRIEYV